MQLYVTFVEHVTSVDAAGVAVDHAGETGDSVYTGVYSMPRWRGSFVTSYSNGPFRITGMARYVGGGKFNVLWTDADIDDNSIKGRTYFDLAVQYDIVPREDGRKLQVYGVVQNLLNRDPPIIPSQVLPTNAVFYDMIGRTYKIGIRFSF